MSQKTASFWCQAVHSATFFYVRFPLPLLERQRGAKTQSRHNSSARTHKLEVAEVARPLPRPPPARTARTMTRTRATAQRRRRRIILMMWLWVKRWYLNNPVGKRTNRPKPVVPKGFLFDPQPCMVAKSRAGSPASFFPAAGARLLRVSSWLQPLAAKRELFGMKYENMRSDT